MNLLYHLFIVYETFSSALYCIFCNFRYFAVIPHRVVTFTGFWICRMHTLLTPWSRVLLEKLTGSAASQEMPSIFGTRRFLAVFTSARHLSLSWANSIQSPQPPPTSWRSILMHTMFIYAYIYIYIYVCVCVCVCVACSGLRGHPTFFCRHYYCCT